MDPAVRRWCAIHYGEIVAALYRGPQCGRGVVCTVHYREQYDRLIEVSPLIHSRLYEYCSAIPAVAPSDFDRHISAYSLTALYGDTALSGDPHCQRRTRQKKGSAMAQGIRPGLAVPTTSYQRALTCRFLFPVLLESICVCNIMYAKRMYNYEKM